MHLRKLTASILRVRLRKPFRHASAVRHYSDNILVEAELDDGTIGWGEGVPREYVTGETAEGALQQFAQSAVAEQLAGEATSWPQALSLCERFSPAVVNDDPRGCHGNSLRAAVELSLLDVYGKLFGEPVSRAFAHFAPAEAILHRSNVVRYSTTIDAEHSRKLWRSAFKMCAYGFRQCKVKVGADAAEDARRLAIVRRWIGSGVDLRIDANEAWRTENMVANAHKIATANISCIEQPIPHADVQALADLRTQIDTPVMLDESLASLHDAREAIRLSACDLFNIRISKCGGLLNSLRLAAVAQQHGIGYQLGCHPGETGILSAAGRHFATTVGEIRYLEGSYDHHVLAELVTKPDLTFAYGGRARALPAAGLGVSLDRRAAEKHLRETCQIVIEQ